ncbi:helix-turn-helix transcriptional regulator [Streptomyces sp. LHD-70]|uniref:helix-turn-helix domain-containing protein n=1 Tax=Streptomyces sp. LHD-70 TaxID=3072140 RepID=UPI00280F01FB|nr:helix-turn-helix transcriptional regulator [Streptomyces sp. LHD-70]MDQ8707871.1 helix-turn-helix transcriptional regulator [Streptomyces sp. LHD-70]
MGRKPKDLPGESNPIVELAAWLREQRARTGMTYAQLGERLECNKSTLSRATNGIELPSLELVERFAMACGADVSVGQRLHRKALRELRIRQLLGKEVPMRPDMVVTPTDLWNALVSVYALSGLTYRRAEAKAKRLAEQGVLERPISRATFHNFVTRRTPLTRRIMLAVLAVSDVPQEEWMHWESAWRCARMDFVREAAREGSPAARDYLTHQREHLPRLWGVSWSRGVPWSD